MSESQFINQQGPCVWVASIMPFWRWAVGPINGQTPAIPFYRRSAAEAFFAEAKAALPWSEIALYRRRGFRSLEVAKLYQGTSPV